MTLPGRIFKTRSMALIGSSLAAALILILTIRYIGTDNRIAKQQAMTLIAELPAQGEVTPDVLTILKDVAASDHPTRREIARLLQDEQYTTSPFLLNSTELISKSIIGVDYDGEMSKELSEGVICEGLESDPAASAQEVSLYLVPHLNPANLDSEYCARILIDTLVTANPNTLLQRAKLLESVVGQLTAAQAKPYVAEIVGMMNTASAADIDVLFSALQKLDRTTFADELQLATQTLVRRISEAQSSSDIALLFESINFLKYEITAEQLTPVLDTTLSKVLMLRDSTLTHSFYFTLLDLKISHPSISFGQRADYLMGGINKYGDNVEIYDYTGVLRLEEEYSSKSDYNPAKMAEAVLSAIRNLAQDEYISSIRPYCLKFLELSSALSDEEFAAGLRLLFEQLQNQQFIFQRECLHDPRMISRIEPGDIPALTALILNAMEGERDSLGRIAGLIELLDLIGSGPSEEQVNQIAALVISAALVESDPLMWINIGFTIDKSSINFSPNLYPELFVIFANATGPSSTALAQLFEKLPTEQQADLINSALDNFFAQTEPKELIAAAQFLIAIKSGMSKEETQRVALSLVAAVENAQDLTEVPRLTGALGQLTTWSVILRAQDVTSIRTALKTAIFRHFSASSQRKELAALITAVDVSQLPIDAKDRPVLENAIFKYLNQIESVEGIDGQIRKMMKRFKLTLSPSSVEELSELFVNALANESQDNPITNYAASIETVARNARAGELTVLFQVLSQKLGSAADPATYSRLLPSWIAVETSANKDLPPEQRLPQYAGILSLTLSNGYDPSLLIEQFEKITLQDFQKDVWKVVAWMRDAGFINEVSEAPEFG